MHTPWNPRLFLIPEDEMVDELCLAAIMYRRDPETGPPVGYDTATLRQVTAEVTWILFNLQSGDHDDLPPIPIQLT